MSTFRSISFTAFLLVVSIPVPLFSQDFDLAYSYFETGSKMYQQGKYAEAVHYFNTAEPIFAEFRGQNNLNAYVFLWRGLAYTGLFDYDHAVQDFSSALALSRKQRLADVVVSAATQLAQAYYAVDDLAQSQAAYEDALQLAGRYNQQIYYMTIYEGIGNVEFSRGKYDAAETQYQLALEYAEYYQSRENIVSVETRRAQLAFAVADYATAINRYKALLERPGIRQSMSYGPILNNYGNAESAVGNLVKALDLYAQALQIAETTGNTIEIIRLYIHMGGIYHKQGRYQNALEAYFTALPAARELNRLADQSVCLFNIGLAYDSLGRTEEAIPYLEESIALKDQLRVSASGRDRMDYLASQVHVYQWLVLEYLYLNDIETALSALEQSSALYLNEQLSRQSDAVAFPGVSAIQQSLDETEVIVNYGTTSTPWFTCFTISDDSLTGDVLPDVETEGYLSDSALADFSSLAESSRGLNIIGNTENLADPHEFTIFELVDYYRILLVTGKNDTQLFNLGRYFYDIFIKPVEDSLTGKSHLIIVPDNVIAFLPFETFVMPDGRYLVEKYSISYVQSLAVAQIVKERTYSDDRSSFLGIGKSLYSAFNTVSQSGDFAAAGTIKWNNLPGTTKEVQNIQPLFADGACLPADTVNETEIKHLSDTGSLGNYRILHFATHGMVLPSEPQLSALVLTDTAGSSNDGYLTVDEIQTLNIQADFVNLSACETGLGRIYGGEGVVGLAQAFLIAGANSLSVSLWQVADTSTSEFMVQFYTLVTEESYTFKDAMAETKRRFILSTTYNHPYYWGPFIFYGQ